MNTLSYKTKSAKNEDVVRAWHIVDADGMVVGRLATAVAKVLRGKHKTSYTPHVDTGDYVIIVNADKIRFTGDKMKKKVYLRFSGYPGGQKKARAEEMMDKKPTFVMRNAIVGMLPKNKLGRAMIKKLYLYEGAEHPHEAQDPKPLKF